MNTLLILLWPPALRRRLIANIQSRGLVSNRINYHREDLDRLAGMFPTDQVVYPFWVNLCGRVPRECRRTWRWTIYRTVGAIDECVRLFYLPFVGRAVRRLRSGLSWRCAAKVRTVRTLMDRGLVCLGFDRHPMYEGTVWQNVRSLFGFRFWPRGGGE